MEVPVQLQTAALVLGDGLDSLVKRVWSLHTLYIDHILSWHCPCLWIIRQHGSAAYVGMVVVVVYRNTMEKSC